jgi:colicin import membrane protein
MSEAEKGKPSTLSEAEAEAARAKAEYEEAKANAEEAKPEDGTLRQSTISDAVATSEAAAVAEAAYEAAKANAKEARAASETAWKAEYDVIKADVVEPQESGQSFTNKYKQDRIFRREMGEPEFFLFEKHVSMKSVRTQSEEQEISRQVQIPKDQTPQYNPEHVLSPEFGGDSSYESGLDNLRNEAEQKLDQLLNDPEASSQDIKLAKEAIKKLDYLFENYNLGMNVFRTAKGGRDKIKG